MGKTGPGYASPLQAMREGPRERLLWVVCVRTEEKKPDYLATIDVDPASSTFSKVIHRLFMPHDNDELHHMGWNTCSSCHGDPDKVRNRLVIPALGSARLYVVDISKEKTPAIFKVVEPSVMLEQNASYPHTAHCLPSGEVMISTMGDKHGDARGTFVSFDAKTFEPTEPWTRDDTPFGYDFWYQPAHDVLISTEWGTPSALSKGFNPKDIAEGKYGNHLNVYSWKERKLVQRLDLGQDGCMALEIRFLHDPMTSEGYVGCALNSNIFRFYRKPDGSWDAHKVISVPAKQVDGWVLPTMPGIISDILISLDDRFLYFSNWVHGDIRQYDITNRKHPKLVGQIFVGGSIYKGGAVKVTKDEELKDQPDAITIKGKKIVGGPQMLQLSLDGTRLYFTTSLYSPWDYQFYPDTKQKGSMMLQVDVDTAKGGLTLNPDFLVDFSEEPDGAVLAHEIRYPGGDCTSDIWLPPGYSCCSDK